MKNIFILLTFLFSYSFLLAQKKIEKVYYSSGRIKSTGILKDGEPDGVWRNFYENGKLYQVIYYSNGKINGPIKFFHENGKTSFTAIANDGLLEGESNGFGEDGRLSFKANFRDGLLDGECIISDFALSLNINGTFKNGKPWAGRFMTFEESPMKLELYPYLKQFPEYFSSHTQKTFISASLEYEPKSEYLVEVLSFLKILIPKKNTLPFGIVVYSDGFLNGQFTFYQEYKNSKFHEIGTFSNDKKIGEWRKYHENGNISIIGHFENDKRVAKWSYFDINNKLSLTANYSNGELSGQYKGKLGEEEEMEEGMYTNGEKDGEWKTYHSNGKLHEIGRYENGKKQGEWKSFYKNGSNCESGFYANGLRVGKWSLFDKSKMKIATGNYEFNERSMNLSDKTYPELEVIVESISESLIKAPPVRTLTILASLGKTFFYYDNKLNLNVNTSNFKATSMRGLKDVIKVYNPKFIIIKGIKSSYEDFVDVVRILNEYNIFFQVAEINELENELVHLTLKTNRIQ